MTRWKQSLDGFWYKTEPDGHSLVERSYLHPSKWTVWSKGDYLRNAAGDIRRFASAALAKKACRS